ncbi:MAG: Rpn family recombination-promoting nuclease/putative transposase [Proteobacteria bacterium]|nr:Rpn family recombination-promoting nuclease/putative transposase [Pseudomonadota bacterium]
MHDAFFKQVLGDPELAGRFLREHLPAAVVEQLGPEMPEPLPASFVDEELRQHHSDLLFRLRLKAGGDAFAYLLLEHKSSCDDGTRLQLLRYVVRLLTTLYEQNGGTLPLPPVVSVVAHQGPGEWTASCEFADLFGDVSPTLRPYLPSFRHSLVDLPAIADENLSTMARLRALLKALKYARRPESPERLDIILAEAGLLERRDLLLLLTYLDKGPVAVSREMMHQVLRRRVPDREEQIMGWITQPYFEEGLEQGRAAGHAAGHAEGHAVGRAEGQAKSLVRLLERRFGALPEPIRAQVFSADVQTLDAWLDRVFDAKDLQAVFAEPLPVQT